MSNFWQRALTGSLFLIVMIGGITWCYWSMAALLFIIAVLGQYEFYSLVKTTGSKPQVYTGLAITILFFISVIFGSFYLFTLLPLLFVIFFVELYKKNDKPFENVAYTLLGILYVAVPFMGWVWWCNPAVHNIPALTHSFLGGIDSIQKSFYNPHLLLGFFFLIWTNDTGAYLTGRAFGKHKLWERISPKKTWEGFIGGMLLSIAIGCLIAVYYKELNMILWALLGLIVSVFGTLGDLVESMFKRSINVKESGGLLPGHGGILDRFDGVLLSTPFVLGFLQAILILSFVAAD